MDYSVEYLLSMIKAAFNDTMPELPGDDVNWMTVYQNAARHNILGLIYPVIVKFPEETKKQITNFELWKQQMLSIYIRQMNQWKRTKELLQRASQANIKPIVVKGIILASLYPEPFLRISGDVDMYVDSEAEESMKQLLVQNGYHMDETNEVDCETTFERDHDMRIELHNRLWEEKQGVRLANLEALKLTDPKSMRTENFDGCCIYTLGVTQHLIYLIYHMVKHFFVSGVGIRHLMDLYIYIVSYKQEIDYEYFMSAMTQLGYVTFLETVLLICDKYFTMPQEIMKYVQREYSDKDEEVLLDIIDSGTFGSSSIARWKSGRILRLYYENEEKQAPGTRIGMYKDFIFPKKHELQNQAVEKSRFSKILPVAWVQRVIYLMKRRGRIKKDCSLKDRIRVAERRMKLIKEMNLFKNDQKG